MKKNTIKETEEEKSRKLTFASGKQDVMPWNPSTTHYSKCSLLLKTICSEGLLFPTLLVCVGWVSHSVDSVSYGGARWCGVRLPKKQAIHLYFPVLLLWSGFWAQSLLEPISGHATSTCISARNTLLHSVLLLFPSLLSVTKRRRHQQSAVETHGCSNHATERVMKKRSSFWIILYSPHQAR